MIYVIKAKKDLCELTELLKKQKLSFDVTIENQVIVNVKSSDEHEVFLRTLSLYIIYYNFYDVFIQALVKKGKSVVESKKLALQQEVQIYESNYFPFVTRILLSEYFKNVQIINIDSFSMFNIKGFKEEIRKMVDILVQFENNDEIKKLINDSDNATNNEIQNALESIKNKAISKGFLAEDFFDINIFGENGRLYIENKNGILINKDFFVKTLEVPLEFSFKDDIEDKGFTEDILLLNCINAIFPVKNVFIHKFLSDEAKKIVDYNIKMANENGDKKIKITYCDGCNKCE